MLRANMKRPVKRPIYPGTVHPIVAMEIIVLNSILKGRTALKTILAARKPGDHTTRGLRKSGIQLSNDIWRQQVARDTR